MTTGYSAAADGVPTIPKAPAALLDYPFDWSNAGLGWLATGETVVSNTVTVDAGLTNPIVTASTTAVTVWLSGGTIGRSYLVSCTITTSAGRTDTRSIRVIVRTR